MRTTRQPETAEVTLHPTSVQLRAEGMTFNEIAASRVGPVEGGGVNTEKVPLELNPPFMAKEGSHFLARGLANVALGKCLQDGRQVAMVNQLRTKPLANGRVGHGYEAATDFIRTQVCGTFDVSQGFLSYFDLLRAFFNAFPNANIVIVHAKDSDALASELIRVEVPHVALAKNLPNHRGYVRIVVATFGTLGFVPWGKVDLVFVIDPFFTDREDPRRVVFNEPEDVKKICVARSKLADVPCPLFCIRTDVKKLSPWEAAGHAEAFGMRTIRLSDPPWINYGRPVEVLWLPCMAHMVIPGGATEQKVKETAATCPVTVRRLARLIRAITDRDRAAVGKFLGPNAPEKFFGSKPLPHLIYAGTLDAAERLARALPGDWPILDGACELPLDGFGVIATEAGVRRCRGPQFDLIIRADFGPGMPPFPGSWFESAQPFTKPIYLVDFAAETQHPLLKRWTRSRREAYLAADWRERGVTPLVHEYRRFLQAVAPRRAAR